MSAPRLADQAYASILALIEAQDLQVGDRLPAEAKLAQSLAVSRAVIREALVRLESDGITEARRGAGSFVTRRPSALLARHMSLQALPANLGTYELRFVLEAEAARLAALRHTGGDKQALAEALARLCGALQAGVAADEEDYALHRAIMQATGNDAFVVAFESQSHSLMQIMKAGVDIARNRDPAVVEAMIREHRDIVEAILLRDADRAGLAMRWHLSQGRLRLMP